MKKLLCWSHVWRAGRPPSQEVEARHVWRAGRPRSQEGGRPRFQGGGSPRFQVVLALLLVSLLSGCSHKKETVSAAADNATPPPVLEVRTTPAVERLIKKSIETVGSLVPDEQVVVAGQVGGEIAELTVDVGSPVKAGQIIARISPKEYELRLQQAEAALAQARAMLGEAGRRDPIDIEAVPTVRQAKATLDDARAQMERTQRLVESGDVPRQRWDTVEANYRAAEARHQAARDEAVMRIGMVEQRQAEVRLARKKLEDSAVRAPISGFVSVRHKSRGDFINEQGGNRDIVTIVRLDPIRLQANVAEVGVSYVKPNMPVRFTTDAYPGRDFPARVARISPVLNQQTRLLMVEAVAPNPQGLLKPGMFARVYVDIASDVPAVFIPSLAVVSVAGVEKVFVAVDGKAVERKVRLGKRDGESVEITEGLKPGEQVITTALDRLTDGTPVRVS
ncbi:efflux RND transporter periplasmic adaptor subunit [Chloracidobacterium aggregatum]|uniref:Efflux RND transporter periplasmic adaptor subunit n=1 Tax=Chloracidobacterium sp. N TaxID=2821540 RepID=A0ABX8B0S4_9BACT|nr:efflux RND transporter periplasmic adaptor subunit [Chloracidobacterium aggregatum]QUV85109.1 efflux RND transporter periplasmic adaptor subunit [Chloracidobacterium sp. 2]QUV88491.1 efflux RND transporter periplasmic adaptor subunit [Chloracidobacterium sp. S]QUV91414.1 efflux RND transporter periplasmic adaptor subunit [Chloracidobacterium sp. A]QUV94588.1 efflux RND transporter periplasmic adaptor subunit [Chloracidobacterium sp. N]QUV97791.1 efflux RND transporter periplasmic adaptor su